MFNTPKLSMLQVKNNYLKYSILSLLLVSVLIIGLIVSSVFGTNFTNYTAFADSSLTLRLDEAEVKFGSGSSQTKIFLAGKIQGYQEKYFKNSVVDIFCFTNNSDIVSTVASGVELDIFGRGRFKITKPYNTALACTEVFLKIGFRGKKNKNQVLESNRGFLASNYVPGQVSTAKIISSLNSINGRQAFGLEVSVIFPKGPSFNNTQLQINCLTNSSNVPLRPVIGGQVATKNYNYPVTSGRKGFFEYPDDLNCNFLSGTLFTQNQSYNLNPLAVSFSSSDFRPYISNPVTTNPQASIPYMPPVTTQPNTPNRFPSRLSPNPQPQPQPPYKNNNKNLIQTATQTGQFKTFLTAVERAGLTNILNNSELTVFAPTDQAFIDFTKSTGITVESLLQPENRSKLENILKYHIVYGSIYPDSFNPQLADARGNRLIRTLNGQLINVQPSQNYYYINLPSTLPSAIISSDIKTSNGVIYGINNVLIPGTYLN
jgi:uncharacterized surface protein with fasciclin (FAS1) repeats